MRPQTRGTYNWKEFIARVHTEFYIIKKKTNNATKLKQAKGMKRCFITEDLPDLTDNQKI